MPEFSPRLLHAFMQTLTGELSGDKLPIILETAGLSPQIADPKAVASMDASASAKAYADVQKALRAYYGRGARGILLRVGAQLWHRLLNEAPLTVKPQIAFTRGLATKDNPKPALDLAAKLFSTTSGDLTVHTLDRDLLLVDHPSHTASGQHVDEPICWVTMGLVREALYWATNREYDVTEISCRAVGGKQCEFKVTR